MYDDWLIELDQELRQNRIDRGLEKEEDNNRYVPRVGKVQKQKSDVKRMLRDGFDPEEISTLAHIPWATVQNTIDEIRREREEMERRPLDCWPEGEGGYYAIFQP